MNEGREVKRGMEVREKKRVQESFAVTYERE